jgi:trehalose-6-phosphate synthase/HAMP domain-containing protein
MRVTWRLLLAIWLSELLVIGTFAVFQVRAEQRRLLQEVQRRAALLGDGLRDSVEGSVRRGSKGSLVRTLKRRRMADGDIVVVDNLGTTVAAVPDNSLPAIPMVIQALAAGREREGLQTLDDRPRYVRVSLLRADGDEKIIGALAVVLDATHLDTAVAALAQYNALRFVALAVALSVITPLIVRASVTQPLSAIADWAKTLKAGSAVPPPTAADAKVFGALALEVAGLARSLYRARAAAQHEAALRLAGDAVWTEERLKLFVRARLGGRTLFVVSNREPVSHVWHGTKILAQTPASGVVTAIEPVMRACGGVWVAHGSADGDRETSDARGRLGLPDDDPRYTLRRVWLSQHEEQGYYYGFSNEGLWPLCHVVHARPTFRPEDWQHYRAVNDKFAEALLEEMNDTEAPLVLVQDYHFALLPAIVKQRRPDARVAIFWHIPWPNSEAFGICPWQKDIVHGMLGADLIGFHTQYHCNNFLETVDRGLEARIDAEHFAVVRGDHITSVKPYPISVAPEFLEDPPTVSREAVLRGLGISAEFLGVGVERIDYTKGLRERFVALRRFFERHPEYRERVVFVQLAAPSRSRITRYQELQTEIHATVQQVNSAVGSRGWKPIVYLEEHHDRRDIWPFYRHADFCMVSSLHDGMNLVAKEFVSVRDDDDGALILSRFTGAARELRDALIVNPYDVDEMADAIAAAIEMPVEQRMLRMRRMREVVREHNIYRWAGVLLGDMTRIPERQEVRTG